MPARIACAVVHGEPPTVFVAEDQETLNWVLALHVVAAASPHDLPDGVPSALRTALTDERWGEAVALWMQYADVVVDVYPSMDLFTASDVELAPLELQFRPLFRT